MACRVATRQLDVESAVSTAGRSSTTPTPLSISLNVTSFSASLLLPTASASCAHWALPHGSSVLAEFKGFGQKRTKPERNTRSMAAEGRYGQKSRGTCHFLRGISELAAQILAPGWLVRGGHLDDELWLLAWQVEAAAADKRLAKRRCFAGQDAHVVCMLAADTCRMPSLAGI